MAFDFVVYFTYVVTMSCGGRFHILIDDDLYCGILCRRRGVDLLISTLLCYYLVKNRRSSTQTKSVAFLTYSMYVPN